uniref:DNA damage-binding protein 1 n=1 Tax=Rhizophora mucronata TaxID=61149 RepID=A0A2P2KL47_RHIMU
MELRRNGTEADECHQLLCRQFHQSSRAQSDYCVNY